MNIKPTNEQLAVVDAASRGDDIVVKAYAGTGKTSTMQLVADRLYRNRICYLAFNREIVISARKRFPENVICSTIHSLAYKAVGYEYEQQLKIRMTGSRVAKLMALDTIQLPSINALGDPILTPTALGRQIMRCIERYCASSDLEIGAQHVVPLPCETQRDALLTVLYDIIVNFAQKTWRNMVEKKPGFGMTHDGYLKIWALQRPNMGYDVILLDEAQDTTSLVIDLLRQQQKHGTQIVVVGDSYQQIYAWRGAVDALERFPADSTCYLTESFRFGKAIAEAANKVLKEGLKAERGIIGNAGIKDKVNVKMKHPDAILVRTNANLFCHMLALMKANIPFYIRGDIKKTRSLLEGIIKIRNGQTSDIIELAGINSWRELKEIADENIDPEISRLVKIVEEKKGDIVLQALDKMARDRSETGIVLTTAHQAKGLQWNNVYVADDFLSNDMSPAELNLVYVAVTRARRILNWHYVERRIDNLLNRRIRLDSN